MELILISESKLKVTLTRDDMDGYSLTCDSIDYDNTETRRAFWDILDEAKHRTGFDAARDRIFIQVYPDRSGGCELYVTKLPSDPEGQRSERLTCRIRSKAHKKGACIYRFETLDALLSSCARLGRSGYRGVSSAYSDARDGYYLMLEEDIPTFVNEYGVRMGSEAEYYISEYCGSICARHAVQTLGALA